MYKYRALLFLFPFMFSACDGGAGQAAGTVEKNSGITPNPLPDMQNMPSGQQKLRVVYFFSTYCDSCYDVKDFLPKMEQKWGEKIIIESKNIDTPAIRKEFLAYAAHYGNANIPIPAVFVGPRRLLGKSMIIEDLDGAIQKALDAGEDTYQWVPRPQARLPSAGGHRKPEEQSAKVIYFYSPFCQDCGQAEKLITKLCGDKIQVEHVDIYEAKGLAKFKTFCDRHDIKRRSVPMVYAGGKVYSGLKEIRNIQFTSDWDKPYEPLAAASGGADMGIGVSDLSATVIAAAGFVDGINPCAFTTIIFLISMLAWMGKSKRQIALVGVGFTGAVFFTYLMLGLGFFHGVKMLAVSSGLSRWLSIIVGCGSLLLAAWSFVDFVRYMHSGNTKKMTLVLPDSVKRRIHNVMRSHLAGRNVFLAAVFTGVAVSLLESLCTGQTYLPTIILINRVDALRDRAVFYLIIYNLMFIIPLVVVLCLGYFGTSSQKIALFVQHHLGAAKFTLAILFAALGVLVLVTL